jgi:flagella basal body P-ring formation protein FlgA
MNYLPRVLLLSIFLTLGLHALTLQKNYYTPTKNIYLHTLIKNTKNNPLLYTITEGRYTKKISTKKVVKKLLSLGYKVDDFQSNYIKFTHEIPFDRKRLKKFLLQQYNTRYKNIQIKKITIHSRGHLKTMPSRYTIHIQSNAILKDHGIFFIRANKRDLFFNYTIDATLTIYKARKKIKRSEELSLLNLYKSKVKLVHFFAPPLYIKQRKHFEAKHLIKKDAIITQRDVILERLVRRGNSIKVTLKENNLLISFEAKALSDAIYGDIIRVKQPNNHILQVKVIGKNQAEVL